MATTSEARALPFFTDLLGQPLQAGFIYIGQAGLDPVAYPAVITSDIAGTVVVAQPVRTTNGHAAAAGALIHLFVPIPYSITILDSAGRLVYASLQETDPVAVAIGSSSVQSASDLAALRAMSGISTNQVWVPGFGMYFSVPTDTTSPESIPTIIVGNDGTRYHLSSMQFVDAGWVKVSQTSPSPASQGGWFSWDDEGSGETHLTTNRGLGSGGFVMRTVNADNSVETGRVTIGGNGSIASTGDISTTGNLGSNSGAVFLRSDGSRSLSYSTPNDTYVLPNSGLVINNSKAITEAMIGGELVNIFQNHLVGCILITNSATSPTPGTWFPMGTGIGSTGIAEWLRIA